MWKKKIWSSPTEKLRLVSLGGTKGAGAWEKGMRERDGGKWRGDGSYRVMIS